MANPFVALPDGQALSASKPKKKKRFGSTVGSAAKQVSTAVNQYNTRPSKSSGTGSRSTGTTSYSPPAPSPAPAPPSSPPSRPTSSGSIPTVTKPKPKPPSIEDFLAGDEVFQQVIRGGQRTLQDFLSELTRKRGEAQTNFGQITSSLETDRERQLERLRDEFASRGLLQSGIFAQEQGQFQEDFMSQMQRLEEAQNQFMQDLIAQETGMRRQQELEREAAKQEALARRAARYNIGV